MKPQHLALTAAAALVAGALVKWLLADDDDEKDDQAAHRKQAALRARAREIKAQKAMARRPKRARPTAAKRLQQNNALAVAYGGSQEAVDVAARALRAAEAAARERLDAALKVYDGTAGDAPEIEVDLAWWELMDARQRRSLGRQLADTVAKCRRALKPTIVTLSSYTNEAKAHLEAIGSAKWPVIRDARDTWKRRRERTARVIYLTPDADKALEGLEDGVTYVVAGLVDRPVRKNCTRDAAQLHGCEVKRLPLKEFRGAAPKRRREGILNVDVVVHILLRYRDNGGDWAEALSMALPDGKATPHRLQPRRKIKGHLVQEEIGKIAVVTPPRTPP